MKKILDILLDEVKQKQDINPNQKKSIIESIELLIKLLRQDQKTNIKNRKEKKLQHRSNNKLANKTSNTQKQSTTSITHKDIEKASNSIANSFQNYKQALVDKSNEKRASAQEIKKKLDQELLQIELAKIQHAQDIQKDEEK